MGNYSPPPQEMTLPSLDIAFGPSEPLPTQPAFTSDSPLHPSFSPPPFSSSPSPPPSPTPKNSHFNTDYPKSSSSSPAPVLCSLPHPPNPNRRSPSVELVDLTTPPHSNPPVPSGTSLLRYSNPFQPNRRRQTHRPSSPSTPHLPDTRFALSAIPVVTDENPHPLPPDPSAFGKPQFVSTSSTWTQATATTLVAHNLALAATRNDRSLVPMDPPLEIQTVDTKITQVVVPRAGDKVGAAREDNIHNLRRSDDQGRQQEHFDAHGQADENSIGANLAVDRDGRSSAHLELEQDHDDLEAGLEHLQAAVEAANRVDPASDNSGDGLTEEETKSRPDSHPLSHPLTPQGEVTGSDAFEKGTDDKASKGVEPPTQAREAGAREFEEKLPTQTIPVTAPTNQSQSSDSSEPEFTFTAPLPMEFTNVEERDHQVMPYVDSLNANGSKDAGHCIALKSEKEEPTLVDASAIEKGVDIPMIVDAKADAKKSVAPDLDPTAVRPPLGGLGLDESATDNPMEMALAVDESGVKKPELEEPADIRSSSSSEAPYPLSFGRQEMSSGATCPEVKLEPTPHQVEQAGASRPCDTLLRYSQSPQSSQSPQPASSAQPVLSPQPVLPPQSGLSPQSPLSPQFSLSPVFQQVRTQDAVGNPANEADRDLSASLQPQSPQAVQIEQSSYDRDHKSPLHGKDKSDEKIPTWKRADMEATQDRDEAMSPISPQFKYSGHENFARTDVQQPVQAGHETQAEMQAPDGMQSTAPPLKERHAQDTTDKSIAGPKIPRLSQKRLEGKSKDRQRSSALYSPEGSEFEMPGPSDELSEEVRYSLSMLPLMNVAVHIPAFAEFEPPTPNDMAVVHALDEIILQETRKRRSDRQVMANPRRCVLFITCSTARALACCELLGKRSELRVTTHGINARFGRGSYRRRREDYQDSRALDSLFAFQDVIITLASTALMDAERDFLYLKRVALIVFDIDFRIYKENEPCFSERGHPCSVLMRDYYRALPNIQRPRVLAISRVALRPVEYPPIEHNLFCKFLSINVKEGAAWKSCYGKGSRPDDSLMDVETLYYRVQTPADIDPSEGRDRRQSLPTKRNRRDMSELDSLNEEVGPLGVALYQRRFKYGYDRKRSQGRRSCVNINSTFRITCEEALTGLSQKMLHLLNELQLAYAASTIDSPLMALVHAGQPSTAGAVGAVISAVPIFEGLVIRMAIGAQRGSSFESYGSDDNGTTRGLQGDETDEEAVSAFGSGEANILIVATPYSTDPAKDLVAPCPLIFRFDDSVPDPGVDGGGGRCRVVDFQEASGRRSSRGRISFSKKASGDRQYLGLQTDEKEQSREAPAGRKGTSVTDALGPATQIKPKSPDHSSDDDHVEKELRTRDTEIMPMLPDEEDEGGKNTTVHYRLPPQVLLGPSTRETRTCFMYRILVCPLDEQGRSQTKSCRKVGVEDFVFIFSEMLSLQDKTCPLPEISARAGSVSGIAGNLELSYQGQMELSAKEIELGRLYTAALFSVASESVDLNNTFWDGIGSDQRGNGVETRFLRQYLILPASKSAMERQTAEVKVSPRSQREKLFEKYFSPRSETEKFSWPFAKCSIDWEAVHLLTNVVKTREDKTDKTTRGKVNPDAWSDLEGSLIVSKLKGENSMLCGHLQYDTSPLTSLTRSRKFALNKSGTFKDHHDLIHVVGMKASVETVELQAQETASETEKATLDLKEEHTLSTPSAGTAMPVRWDASEKKLVFDSRTKADKAAVEKMDLFDCRRNQEKKREAWTGKVSYTFEKYYEAYSSTPVSHFDQPLLQAGIPCTSSYEQLLRVVGGAPISTICRELITANRSEAQIRLVIPEISERLPVSIGAIFLPAVLARMEQHLSLCELRKYFDTRIGVRGSLDLLRQSMTASHIDPFCNYERLEFLGDSVLKLSCTIRLFTTRPHDTEGQMHNARSFRVSNDRLHRLGIKVGIQNYLIFEHETEKNYRPPGTDFQGKPVKVTVKALADVVESVCGAYFLHGVNSPRISKGTRKKKTQRCGKRKRSFESSDSDMETESAECSEDEMDVTSEEVNKGKDANQLLSAVEDDEEDEEHSLTDNYERILPLSASAVERGYIAGYKFLEVCGVFEDKEPTHKEVLLSAIHAMHSAKTSAPTEISGRAFPPDRRLSQPSEPWDEKFGPLEKKLGYVFKRRPLLMCALTHSSYIKSSGRETAQHQSFQRLEFLGDAIADFCVVRFLYERYPELGPGELTTLKSNVVSNEAFARTSVQLGLHEYLYHGSTSYKAEIEQFIKALEEEKADGQGIHTGLKRCLGEIAAPKMLGDIFEAVMGAIYVDSGLKTVWTVCMRLLAESLRINADAGREDMHPVTELQDLVLRVWGLSNTPPDYQVRNLSGKARTGKVATVTIGGREIATGRGSTLKRAKLKAAVSALKLLQDEDADSVGAKLLRELKGEHVARVVADRLGE